MRKLSPNLFEAAPPRRRSHTPAVITVVLGLLLSPLVFEATLLCTANWRGMAGSTPTVETPVLATIGAGLRSAGDEVRVGLSPVLRRLPWDPSYVVVFGLGWASIAALLLRR